MGAIVGVAGIPGRFPIAAIVDEYTITLTVVGWPGSGSGTCSLFGWNYYQILYDTVTATSSKFDTQRKGWNSGVTAVTGLTTASPGVIGLLNAENGIVTYGDQLSASATTLPTNQRATRNVNIPDNEVPLVLQIRLLNNTTGPLSNTTWTFGFIQLEDYIPQEVAITGSRFGSINSAVAVAVVSSGAGTTSTRVQGSSGVNVAIAGDPVNVAAVGASATPTVVTTGRLQQFWLDLTGKLLNKPYAPPELDWQYAAAASGIVNTTTGVTVKAAAGAAVRNYMTSLDIMAEVLGTASELIVYDGTTATVLWRTKVPTTGIPAGRNIPFPTPLKGTANTLMGVATLTASGTGAVYANAQGYTAP